MLNHRCGCICHCEFIIEYDDCIECLDMSFVLTFMIICIIKICQVTVIANIDEMDRDDLIMELINAKVQVASLALENEEERKRSQTLTAKLKMYSKRVLNLEEELGSNQ
jgi:hypothetical protein